MNENMAIIWLIALVVMIIAELSTMQLVSIWFAAGALLALVGTLLGAPFFVQVLLFVAGSLLLLVFTRPIAKRLLPNKPTPTNAELDIGKKAIVIEKIDAAVSTGRVRLDGVDWMGVSAAGNVIEEGKTVVVRKIDGSKLIVEETQN